MDDFIDGVNHTQRNTETRRRFLTAAIESALYDSEREAKSAWEMVDILRKENADLLKKLADSRNPAQDKKRPKRKRALGSESKEGEG